MSDNSALWCVFLPCAQDEVWAVPTRCLAEIVTLQQAGDEPPEQIQWRGRSVPVLDLDTKREQPWSSSQGSAGRIAVFLGVEGGGCDYWGVALRGDGLGMKPINESALEEAPDEVAEHCCDAFRLEQQLYQVPDLVALQAQLTQALATAAAE